MQFQRTIRHTVDTAALLKLNKSTLDFVITRSSSELFIKESAIKYAKIQKKCPDNYF